MDILLSLQVLLDSVDLILCQLTVIVISEMLNKNQFRTISLSVDADLVSTVDYKGKPHLKIPVNMLVGDIVVKPMNSDGRREFVPLAVIAENPDIWNGAHILTDHPGPDNGNSIDSSACTPEILDQLAFGTVFNSRIHDSKLKAICYLDIERSEQLGGDAKDTIDRVNSGQQIELSICPWVSINKASGVSPSGEEYDVAWEKITIADHLALLPNGKVGACSNEKDCGGPRLNSRSNNDSGESNIDSTTQKGQTMKTELTSKLLNLLGVEPNALSLILRTMQDPSDDELRSELFRALRNQPGFDWILEVRATTKKKSVVYSAFIGDRIKIFEHKFTLNADDTVTLTGDPIPGKMGFVPDEVDSDGVTATSQHKSGNDLNNQQSQNCDCNKGDTTMEPTKEIKDLALGLIKAKVFEKDDETFLHGCTAEKLGKFKADLVTKLESVAPVTPVTPVTPVAPVAPAITNEAILAAFPEDIRAVLKDAQETAKGKKLTLVETLSTCGQEKFTKLQLEVMSLTQLESFEAFLPKTHVKVSHAFRPVSNTGNDGDSDYEPPDPFEADLKKLQLLRAN